MIFNEPKDWKQLQEFVNNIFLCIGYVSSVEKNVLTPRGNIDIDVYAIDENSINKDVYIVECKYWNKKIPQTVIHAFTTVMSETGGNFGIIVTKKGLQIGAENYLHFTNIKALTFLEFQRLYFNKWYNNFFHPVLSIFSEDLMGYTEPINSKRTRYIDKLNPIQKDKYFELFEKYKNFSHFILLLRTTNKYSQFEDIENFKEVAKSIGIDLSANCIYELLFELKLICENVINEFSEIFEKNIFKD